MKNEWKKWYERTYDILYKGKAIEISAAKTVRVKAYILYCILSTDTSSAKEGSEIKSLENTVFKDSFIEGARLSGDGKYDIYQLLYYIMNPYISYHKTNINSDLAQHQDEEPVSGETKVKNIRNGINSLVEPEREKKYIKGKCETIGENIDYDKLSKHIRSLIKTDQSGQSAKDMRDFCQAALAEYSDLNEICKNMCVNDSQRMAMIIIRFIVGEKEFKNIADKMHIGEEPRRISRLLSKGVIEEQEQISQRMAGDIEEVDVCGFALQALIEYNRDKLQKLADAGCRIRMIMLDPDCPAAEEAARMKISGISEEQSVNIIKTSYRTFKDWVSSDKYPNITGRITEWYLPCAIFIIKKRVSTESSVKVDFYCFNKRDADRRCVIIGAWDEENYEFYREQFEMIWDSAKEIKNV